MTKPVDIEFLMRGNLSGGLDAAGKSADAAADRVEQAVQRIAGGLAAQCEQVRRTARTLEELREQYDRLVPGGGQTEMRVEIEACSRVLAQQMAALDGLRAEHEKNSAAAYGLTAELRQLQEAMAGMRVAGQQNAQEYQILAQRAGQLQQALGSLHAQTAAPAAKATGLQGVASGVDGVAGAFAAATGILGLFAAESENLIRIQTRVQSVQAITAGLQQVMNTLHKDSAFRLVTVVKMKEMLAAANRGLAVALGISNGAASALMATLTLGLSAVVTGLIVLWDRYAHSQEEAASKAMEQLEIEKQGRAQMLKTRFEIESTVKSLEEFNGTKEQEKAKVDELNRRYGDSFGYYDTIAEWYDVLLEKGEAYIRMLFLQAKVQGLIKKAAEADERVNTLEATPANEVEGATGGFGRLIAQIGVARKGIMLPGEMDREIDSSNEAIKEKLVQSAREQRDAYLDEAKSVIDEIADIGKEFHLGGFDAPPTGDIVNPESLRRRIADAEMRALQRIEDARIALLEEGFEKERAQAKNVFEQKKARIAREEQEQIRDYELLSRSGGKVEPGWREKIAARAATERAQAAQQFDQTIAEIDSREQRAAAEKQNETRKRLEELLAKYRDFEAQRAEIRRQGEEEIATLEEQRAENDSELIDRAIAEARRKIEEGIRSVNNAEAANVSRDNGFLKQLFGDYSSLSFGKLSDLLKQAKQLRAQLDGEEAAEGVSVLSAEELERIRNSPEELEKLRKALDQLLKTNSGGNNKWETIFKTFDKGWKELEKAEKIEDISGAIGTIGGAAASASGELASMFEQMGETEVANAFSGVQQALNAVSNIGQGFAKGGLIGGIGAAIGEMANLLGQAFAAEARHRKALKEIERAKLDFVQQYNLALMKQTLLAKEATNAFGERRIAKAVGVMKVYNDALQEFRDKMKGEAPTMNWYEQFTGDAHGTYAARQALYEEGISKLASQRIVTGHKKTGLFGWGKGRDVYSGLLTVYPDLIDENGELNMAMLQTILNTQKMSDETRKYLEDLVELKEMMDEAEQALQDYLSSTFGALGDSVLECVREMARGVTGVYGDMCGDIASMLEALGEQVVYSLFFAEEFDKLQEEMKSIYSSGKSEEEIAYAVMNLIDDFYLGIGSNMEAAETWMEAFRKRAEELGYELWKPEGATQSGRGGAFTAMTQDQGTKLEGLMTSLQMHGASLDDKFDNFTEGMGRSLDALNRIAENTAALPLLLALWQTIRRDGLKIK